MESRRLTFLVLVAFISICLQAVSSNASGFSMSVYTVTSRSISVRWTKFSRAFSYKITVAPVNSQGPSKFSHFNEDTIIGTVISLIPNTLYNVKVEALDKIGFALAEMERQHFTAPEIPVIDQVYSKMSDSITVEWAEVPGAIEYYLMAENGISFIESIASSSPGTIRGLEDAALYTITVRSANSGGRSQPSRPKDAKTVVSAPVLTGYSPSSDTIEVHWEPVYMAVSYTIAIIRSDGQDIRLKYNITSTNFTFSDLDPCTDYMISIHAWDASGLPGDESTYSQKTRGLPPEDVRIDLSSNSSGNVEAIISWNLPKCKTVKGRGMNYTAVMTSDGSSVQNCTSRTTSCTFSSLHCGMVYSVSVTTNNDAGPSLPSNEVLVESVPCAPGQISVQQVYPGVLTVSWSAVDLGDYYKTFVKRSDGLEDSCNTTATTCEFQSECGYTYYISVFAYNEAGQSPKGDEITNITAPCCPSEFQPEFVSSDTIEVTWSPARGAEIYETKADDGTGVVLCNDTTTVCTLSALKCDTQYSVAVYSYSELRGVNNTCQTKHVTTAPCSPEIINITHVDASTFTVSWKKNNKDANYTVTAAGDAGVWSCTSSRNSCNIGALPCGSVFSVSALATTFKQESLPSYSVPLETAPCCPMDLAVNQVTQSMTNVSWSAGTGAQTYVSTLESTKGQAQCHTLETHCLLGCITCGTNYTVTLQAISETGMTSECTYQGFSSSACCPSGVRVLKQDSRTLRVFWRASGGSVNYIADLYGSNLNYTCSPTPGTNYCDIIDVPCGEVYTTVVSPVADDGAKIDFCTRKKFSVTCSGNSLGLVTYRGRRSVD
ncbi:fibronectin type III domain-containing protein 7 [Latimeria chalumnae]|uniref:fibronectin type III domain-containing protein 7 n=1 Tax=Latimeria chalumnae TaxID=7897 RepID=UPI00313DF182